MLPAIWKRCSLPKEVSAPRSAPFASNSFLPDERSRALGQNLPKASPTQFMKESLPSQWRDALDGGLEFPNIHRFGQVVGKSGCSAHGDVRIHAEAAHSNTGYLVLLFHLYHQIQAAAIG